jgi:hypothetical protein
VGIISGLLTLVNGGGSINVSINVLFLECDNAKSRSEVGVVK